jgi:Mg-chelatase subunit ChlD
MDLGEKIFSWLNTSKQRRKARHFGDRLASDLTATSNFDRLELLCRAITHGTARIHLSDALDLPDPASLFLPRRVGLGGDAEENFSIYVYRLMTFHGALISGLAVTLDFLGSPDALIQSAMAAPAVHRVLVERFCGFPELLTQVHALAMAATPTFSESDSNYATWAKVIERALTLEDFRLSAQQSAALTQSWRKDWIASPFCPIHVLPILPLARKRATGAAGAINALNDLQATKNAFPKASQAQKQEVHIKTVARPEVKTLNERDENPMTHVFEKLLTAEEHQGGSKAQDGSDESQAHAEALSELTLDSVARTQTGADSIFKSDAQIDAFAPDPGDPPSSPLERAYSYPEWFDEGRHYRQDFCTVYESVMPLSPDSAALALPPPQPGLSEKLSSFLNESRWKPRQKDGSEFDLDAVVRWRSQLHGSGPIDQRLYMGRRRLERNLAILILLDSSLSTDAWTGNQRVLDVIRSSISTLGGAFAGLDDRFAVAAFNSYSRRRCDFRWIKQFDDTWIAGRRRLNDLKPDGYTRIGPALRHAHHVLDGVKARRKMILLFSDAKPSDYDRYEGEHGLGDVRKAVHEIKSRGIFIKGIAVAQENRSNLARMFGAGQYQVLLDPTHIANTVLKIFTEMMKQT